MDKKNIWVALYIPDEIAMAWEAYRQKNQVSREQFLTDLVTMKVKEKSNGNI